MGIMHPNARMPKQFVQENFRVITICILTVGCLFFLVRGFNDERVALNGFDFEPVYSGARCLLDHCNPYDSDQLRRVFLEHGGSPAGLRPFRPFNANYPPSALFLVIPFAIFPWAIALKWWMMMTALVFSAAAFSMADLSLPYRSLSAPLLISIFAASSTILMMLAQPAGLTIGLCVIGVWCLIKNKYPLLGIVCFALSLSLKPHLGGLIWLYFVLNGGIGRRRAVQIFFATVLLCLPGILWASAMPESHHWLHDLRVNLIGIAAHGNASDPGPANDEAPVITDLQAAISVFRDKPQVYNLIAYAISGSLVLAWAYVATRARPSMKKHLLGIAAIACLSLLPIYHRQYDTRILLLTFPATALLLAEGSLTALCAALVSLALIVLTSHTYLAFLAQHVQSRITFTNPLYTILVFRPLPVILLVGGMFYLVCFMRTLRHASETYSKP